MTPEDEAFRELEMRLTHFPTEWKRTNELRFIRRNYSGIIRSVLQQKWVNSRQEQWRDVETQDIGSHYEETI